MRVTPTQCGWVHISAFIQPHTKSQALIKQALVFDSTSTFESGLDSKVEELIYTKFVWIKSYNMYIVWGMHVILGDQVFLGEACDRTCTCPHTHKKCLDVW